jgi:hypothetical protein
MESGWIADEDRRVKQNKAFLCPNKIKLRTSPVSMHHQSSFCLTLEACQTVNAWSKLSQQMFFLQENPLMGNHPIQKRDQERFNRFTLSLWYRSVHVLGLKHISDKFSNFGFLYESFQYSQSDTENNSPWY